MTINAPLIENFMVDCIMIDRTRVPDGLGGQTVTYVDGVPFRAAIVKDRSLQARVAEKQGVNDVYTVTTPVGVGLEYHEVFRRLRDGAIFRVTSNFADTKPPQAATFEFEQVTAERWELPA